MADVKMNKFIPVNEPLLNGNEKIYLNECIETGWISSDGPFVKKFEQKFAKAVNRDYGISVCNGTVALEVAIAALGIRKGDEVIIPTFTIISCAAAIVRNGATPVLIDSHPDTWNMDINQIESKITTKTKAIMVVHIYGLPVDMDPVITLAEKYDLKIIEDAAEMIGQTYKGKPCGSFGDISCFSFYPNKHITTGEGGMIVTNDEQLAEKCSSLRNLCFLPNDRFVHEELGWNFRFTNLQAAVGLAQLENLDSHITRKRKLGEKYHDLLSDLENIQLPLRKTDYADNVYWVFGIVLGEELEMKAKEVIKELGSRKIGSRPFFYPMHKQPVFKKMGLFAHEKYPIAEQLYYKGFYVPSGLSLDTSSVEYVAKTLKQLLT
jgi:perosamine synthetase